MCFNKLVQLKAKLVFLALLFVYIPPLYAQLNIGKLQEDDIAYVVRDADTGEVLDQLHLHRPMNPASTMKLVTSYSILTQLGPHFRYVTDWKTRAPIVNGTLEGNLYWKGNGNPVFDQPDLVSLQEQLVQKGIKNINGAVVLDRSIWGNALQEIAQNPAMGFDDDSGRLFTTAPDPHSIAYKVTWLQFEINNRGLHVSTNPPLPNYKIDVNARVTNQRRCLRLNRTLHIITEEDLIALKGSIPRGCDGQKTYINIMDNLSFIKESFLGQWHALGGKGPTSIREGEMPKDDLQVVAQNQSPELLEIVKSMNKFSNNLIARSLFLTLGQDTSNALDAARKISKQLMTKTGVDTNGLYIDNGSGLSRSARVTPLTLSDILFQAYHSGFKNYFIDSLPHAGIDGTLKHRLREYPQLHMKTGTLKYVSALAGYYMARNPSERNLIIVAMVNSIHSRAHIPDLDNTVRSAIEMYANRKGDVAHTLQATQSTQ